MRILHSIKAFAKRFMHTLNERNSSIYSLCFGILNVVLVYLLDVLVKGMAPWTQRFSINAWLIVANILVFLLPFLAVCSIFFSIVGIRRALKGSRSWIFVAIVGLLLGILPLLVSGISRSMWFKILYF